MLGNLGKLPDLWPDSGKSEEEEADQKWGHDRLRYFCDSTEDLYEDNSDDYEDEDEAWDEWYND